VQTSPAPVGVGKTFVACALGHVACGSGFNVRFHRADNLLRLLRQSRLDNSREALMVELSTVDLLIIDDFALEPMNRDESRDIYQMVVERTARATTIITSNRDTADWLALFDDALLGQSAAVSGTTPMTWSSTASPTAPVSSRTSPRMGLRLRLR
jgi:DNA replication protein DnaC